MSLSTDTKTLVDRVIQHTTRVCSGPVPTSGSEEVKQQAGLTTDLLLLENEILVFQSGRMSTKAMTALKGDLEEMVHKYDIS